MYCGASASRIYIIYRCIGWIGTCISTGYPLCFTNCSCRSEFVVLIDMDRWLLRVHEFIEVVRDAAAEGQKQYYYDNCTLQGFFVPVRDYLNVVRCQCVARGR